MNMASKMMKAARVHTPGPPSVLTLESIPIPVPARGQVLIRVRAFGLNRSEMFTRQGHSPGVKFPRVLGIEAVGEVEDAPGGEFKKGDVVATAMGGIGRDFDGGYAEFTCVPVGQVQNLELGEKEREEIGWEVLGAMPEMLQTAYGSLFKALRLKEGERLLVRGATTSIGLAAASLAKASGVFVAGTSRRKDTEEVMRRAGVDEVIVDNGCVAEGLKGVEGRFDKVLELIGTKTLHDSLRCCKEGGIVCQTGIVGDSWTLKEVNPMEFIPSAVCLTAYSGGSEDFMKTPLKDMAKLIVEGKLKLPIGKVFRLDEIVEAHQCMEDNKANGKIVVLV